MASIKQIDANRRNAQLSTGPTTPEGKRASSINALKSGIYAESETIPTENRDHLETLKSEYYDRFQPQAPEARDLVDSLIRNSWLLRRLAAAEASVFNCTCETYTHNYEGLSPSDTVAARLRQAHDGRKLDLLQRRINATERNYHRSLKALQALQPAPEPAQPVESKPASTKLASFPEKICEPEPQPESAPSENCFLPASVPFSVPSASKSAAPNPGGAPHKLASFPPNVFLSDLSEPPTASSAIKSPAPNPGEASEAPDVP